MYVMIGQRDDFGFTVETPDSLTPTLSSPLEGHYFSLLSQLFSFLFFFPDCTDAVPCEGLDHHAHFKDFGFAMLTLFRVSTGDNWNGILKVLFCS